MEKDPLIGVWKTIAPSKKEQGILKEIRFPRVIRKRIRVNFYKMIAPKLLSAIPYLFVALFLFNFDDVFLQPWHKVAYGIAMLFLIATPLINIFLTVRYQYTYSTTSSLDEVLRATRRGGQLFIQFQYVLAFLNTITLGLCILLIPLIYSEQLNTQEILFSYLIGTLVLLMLSRKVWRYYKKIIAQNETFLKKLK